MNQPDEFDDLAYDERLREQTRIWYRVDLRTQPDGSVVGFHSTNDNNDDGIPDNRSEYWETRYTNLEQAIRCNGLCRTGWAGMEVIVTLDGEPLTEAVHKQTPPTFE